MHAAQKQIDERIEMCTLWLRELAQPKELVVEYRPRPGRLNIDHNWRVRFRGRPEILGEVHLRSIEVALPDGEKRKILEERFGKLLKSRNAS